MFQWPFDLAGEFQYLNFMCGWGSEGLADSADYLFIVCLAAAVMCKFKHPNIIKLFGVVSHRDLAYIVMELAPHGQVLNSDPTKQYKELKSNNDTSLL